ncbi:MAG: hypothetical protein O6853_07630 [Actinobacteria bacterium]|nr:hypothetical protein [Actinomycetota bacterium]
MSIESGRVETSDVAIEADIYPTWASMLLSPIGGRATSGIPLIGHRSMTS